MEPEFTTAKVMTSIPSDVVALSDYARLAKQMIPHSTYEYIAGGSASEVTLDHNRTAFDSIKLYNRVLKKLGHGSTRLRLLGENFRHPILLAPVAHQQLVHPLAELASVEAAEAMEAGFIASTLSSVTMEAIAAKTASNKWFQLYFQESREWTLSLVRRAENAGYTALVVTVDTPINGIRNRTQRIGFKLPSGIQAMNLINQPAVSPRVLTPNQSVVFQGIMADAVSWDDLAWLKKQTQLPLIIKGITHPDDALKAQDMGLAGIVISNHGGRALDGAPATIDVLPAIRNAVGDDFLILLDSGIRRGSDIFKAIALGANAVLIGRPQMYALAVAVALGVAHMLRLLREEFEVTMALAGCATLSDINLDCLQGDIPTH